MAEEFQTEICGGNYWWNNINSTRSVFPLMSSSPCSVAANDAGGIGYSTWQTDDMVELKATARTCSDHEASQETSSNRNMVSNSTSLGFLDATRPILQRSSDDPAACNENNGGSILVDSNSTLQMIGFGLSSNWNNHSLFRCSGKPAESNFQETGIDSSSNLPIIQKDWRPKSFSSSSASTMDDDAFKHMNQNHQDLCGGFPIGSASYGFPSALNIESLYDPHSIPQTQPNSLFTNRSMANSGTATATYGVSSNELSATSWSKPSSFLKQQMPSGLHFSNNTPFWNASASAGALNDMRAGVLAPPSQPQPQQYQTSTLINDKPNFPSALVTKPKSEQAPDSASAGKKFVGEPAMKRQKVETPSPLPTFKVRKEKLGDRITALQQLVSPFGKTDTASVLHEAIEYIKFLHDQVSVLSTPYMKNGAPIQHQQGSDLKELEGPKQDLRSRGLCLVPISSTFPVTNETTADFWTPSFGGAFIR